MQAAIIPADNSQPIRFTEITGSLESIQNLVGGDIQIVGLRALSMNMYLNENGKLEGLTANLRATVMCNRAEAIRPCDYINGDAVVLGPIDDDRGEDTGLAEAQQDWLRHFDTELSELRHIGD